VPPWEAVVGTNIELQTLFTDDKDDPYAELVAHPEGHTGLWQPVGTQIGQTYLLRFDCAAHPWHTADQSDFSVWIDDVKIEVEGQSSTVEFSEKNNPIIWESRIFAFEATSDETKIAFIPDGISGFIDNVELLKVDLDIDSDNTNGADAPDRSSAEEALEDDDEEPGKLIGVNNGDRDFDNIPDYADGFDGDTLSDVNFTQLVLEMPDGIDIDKLKVKLTYSASDPASVNVHQESCGSCDDGGDSSWTTRDGKIYMLPSGNMRIWLKDASESRDSASVASDGDFIPSNTEIPFEKLNGDTTERTVTLYVEGIKPSGFPGDDTIKMELGIDSGSSVNYFDVDEVRTTVADVTFKTASGGGFLDRDDYTFGSADFSYSASYDDPASLVIYSMKAGESMNVNTLTLPPAPQIMNDVIDYFVGERSQGNISIPATSVSPDSSTGVTQVVQIDSTNLGGFTYLDAAAGSRSVGSVNTGTAGVAVFDQKELQIVGVRRVNQRYGDPALTDIDAPPFSATDAQALEDYLNNQVFKCANVPWEVRLLSDLDIDYDADENGRLSPSEDSVIRLNGNDSSTDFMVYLVDWIDLPNFGSPGGGYAGGVPSSYVVVAGRNSVSQSTVAHELGHASGLEHPFSYGSPFDAFPFPNDYDPENLMNYTDGIKLRFFQWVVMNPLPAN